MALCDGCVNSKSFGKKCWFYWELKKQCSQFKKSPGAETEFREEE